MRNKKVLLIFTCLAATASAQTLVGLGDSIGEGVQSADANTRTQPNSYLNLISKQMGVSFTQPLIRSGPASVAENLFGRSRVDPGLQAANLAVSGADSTSILVERSKLPASTETDLVLLPRLGSQVQVAEQIRAPFTVCWIGNNDILSAVLSFDRLNATQMTTLPDFTANFQQLVFRLTAWNGKIVFGNIPNVTQIGFLFGPAELRRWLGRDYGLPNGSYTSLVAVLLIKLGLDNGGILQNPDWVLDAAEVQQITDRVSAFNRVIAQTAAAAGMPVADINGLFASLDRTPLVVRGVSVTTRYNGGLFSLDGVHPSNFGNALAANAFIGAANSGFHWTVPLIDQNNLQQIFATDPFVDFNGNLRVKGRLFAGLLETLGPLLGISGDNESLPASAPSQSPATKFMQSYLALTGVRANAVWSKTDAIEALRNALGLRRYR